MARLTKPINEQIAEIKHRFADVYVNKTSSQTHISWLVDAAGRFYIIDLELNHDRPPPFTHWKGQNAVKCSVFYPELCSLSDYEFYHLPHTWLPRFHTARTSFDYWKKYKQLTPLVQRGPVQICSYANNYLEQHGINLYEIMKLASSYMTTFEYWRCGFGWQGGGLKHEKIEEEERILRETIRRGYFASTCSAALESKCSF